MKKIIKTIINKIIKNNFLRNKFLKMSIFLNNFSYTLIKLFLVAPGEIHPKHKIMNYHQFFVDNVDKNDAILDLGCGNGAVAYDVSEKAKKVVGIDIDIRNIEKANKKFDRDNLKFICGDATKYDFSSFGVNKFDKIILSNVLEHIEDRITFLTALHKVSDTILVRVPMVDRDWLTVYKKENGYNYVLDDSHFIEFTHEILKEELEKSGWKLSEYSVQFGETWGIVINK